MGLLRLFIPGIQRSFSTRSVPPPLFSLILSTQNSRSEADEQGVGTLLMEEAERIAREEHGSGRIAVISGKLRPPESLAELTTRCRNERLL